jgi:hypothetical protein
VAFQAAQSLVVPMAAIVIGGHRAKELRVRWLTVVVTS